LLIVFRNEAKRSVTMCAMAAGSRWAARQLGQRLQHQHRQAAASSGKQQQASSGKQQQAATTSEATT